MIALFLFWSATGAIVYAYAGYPAALWLLTRLYARRSPAPDGQEWFPSLTIIISAFNEEKVIERKLEETLELDYPRHLLEIVVLSDGSTDATCAIVARYAHRGVVLRHYEGRIGKTACLNLAVPLAKGEFVVFSDANSRYAVDALKALRDAFHDPSVGFATGWTLYGEANGGAASGSLGLYARLELITKTLEGRLGSCVGADGAIFAIRKSLYQRLMPYDINDFVIPLSINRQGYRGVLQRGAICHEADAGGSKGEFQRQVRITNRTIRAIFNYRDLLNPLRHPFFAWQLFSHKLCKFLVPLFMAMALIANMLLAQVNSMYMSLMAAQIAFYCGVAISLPMAGITANMKILETAKTFVVLNTAIAVAWIKYFQGETYTTWLPTKR